MYIPKQLTTVTTLSKLIIGILFITLPFVGFWLGMEYQQYLTQVESSRVLGLSINAMCSATPWYLLLAFAIIAISFVSAGATLIWGLIYFFLKRKSLSPKKHWLKLTKIVAIEILVAGIAIALIVLNTPKSQYSGGCNDYLPPVDIKINIPFNKAHNGKVDNNSNQENISSEIDNNEVKEYTSCVCCCPTDNPPEICLYHSKGESIENIIKKDKENTNDCSMFGCTQPTKYIYCD